MAEFLFIACPIDGCNGSVIWVLEDDRDWMIACPACGKQYELNIKKEGDGE